MQGEQSWRIYDAFGCPVKLVRPGDDSASPTLRVIYGDGERVKGTVNGVTTTYVGNYYEMTGTANTKYYYANGVRTAEKRTGYIDQNGVYWLLSDHLGSTTITAYTAGGKKAELRYAPWGWTRYTNGNTLTSQRYTGQREEDALDLYWYNSRWYDSQLGRFTSADSIIPDESIPLSNDRYAYTFNNPVKYIDPTGHRPCSEIGCPGDSYDPTALAESIRSDPTSQRYWDGLTKEERQVLSDAGWDKGSFNDHMGGGNATDIGWTYQDPAVWFVVLVSAGKLTPSAVLFLQQIFKPIEATGTFVVYQLVENGATRYIGMTCDYFRRASEHMRTRGWAIEPIQGLEQLSKVDARAVEQVLIELYGLSNLYNKINSIATSNPIYQQAIQRGTEILKSIGMLP